MKQFKEVFLFEFLEMIKKKGVIVTTIIISVVFLGVTFIPGLVFKSDVDAEAPDAVNSVQGLVFVFEDDTYSEDDLKTAFGVSSLSVLATREELKKAIENKEYEKGIVLESATKCTLVANDLAAYDEDEMVITAVLTSLAQSKNFVAAGINPEDAQNAMHVEISIERDLIGKDSQQGFIFAYIIMFMLYMLIAFFGQSAATSVAREKDSRTMELLITSTNPRNLILGKVMAMGLIGVLQILVIALSAVVGLLINRGSYPPELLSLIEGTMNASTLIVYAVFSVLGYMLYLFIYAALGSLVSKMEDVGSAVTPITFMFVAAFMVATFSLQMPSSSLSVVSSFIPFVSFFTMPIRYMLTTVPVWQLAVSLAILVLTVGIVEKLSVYIYRYGSLNYGNKIQLKEIFRSLRSSKK